MSAVPPGALDRSQTQRQPASILSQPHDQYGRRGRLIVANNSEALDLSALRFNFATKQADQATPNICLVRVYNLKADTVARVLREYSRVTIEAGYETGKFAMVFDGTIKQFKRGRENAIDSYLDIFGADGDLANLFGVVNTTLPAGQNGHRAQAEAIAASIKDQGISQGPVQIDTGFGGVLPRDKVLFGMAIAKMRMLARNSDTTWSIQNGSLTMIKRDGYLPGDVININANSGMVQVPEATELGIVVRILMNPSIKVGQRIRINNADINQTLYRGQTSSGFPGAEAFRQGGFPGYGDLQFFANVTYDGIYRVLVIEHEGDTRANDWYSNIVCLQLDPSAIGSQGSQGATQDFPQDLSQS